MYSHISPSKVFSILAFTTLALISLLLLISFTSIIGVLIFYVALIISLILGTPKVIFIEATPAKWKVFRVIYVPGSPIL